MSGAKTDFTAKAILKIDGWVPDGTESDKIKTVLAKHLIGGFPFKINKRGDGDMLIWMSEADIRTDQIRVNQKVQATFTAKVTLKIDITAPEGTESDELEMVLADLLIGYFPVMEGNGHMNSWMSEVDISRTILLAEP